MRGAVCAVQIARAYDYDIHNIEHFTRRYQNIERGKAKQGIAQRPSVMLYAGGIGHRAIGPVLTPGSPFIAISRK